MKKKLPRTKDRAATSVSMRIPVDVLDKLKRIAPMKGVSGYQSLIKYSIGQGLLRDIELVRELDQQDARVEAALGRIGLEAERIQEFWKAYSEETTEVMT